MSIRFLGVLIRDSRGWLRWYLILIKGLVRVIKSSKKRESRECGATFIILQGFGGDSKEGV